MPAQRAALHPCLHSGLPCTVSQLTTAAVARLGHSDNAKPYSTLCPGGRLGLMTTVRDRLLALQFQVAARYQFRLLTLCAGWLFYQLDTNLDLSGKRKSY